MAHREALLEGARKCLAEKGYARTTARDIVQASDTNLGSIGYHFGSKEALLNEAIMQIFAEWTEELGRAAFAEQNATPLERVAQSWIAMLDSFDRLRPLLVSFVEAMAQAERTDELREQMASHYRLLRDRVAEMVRDSLGAGAAALGADPAVIASFLIAVSDGLVLQWLLDPTQTPTGQELVDSLGAALGAALATNQADAL